MGAGPLARTVNKEMPKKEVAWRRKSNKSAPKRPGVPSEPGTEPMQAKKNRRQWLRWG